MEKKNKKKLKERNGYEYKNQKYRTWNRNA